MDSFKNFAKVTVSTGYDAAATSVALTAGHGARLPTAPFNATWWNSTDFPDPSDDSNAEIVRVTAIATDTLTVTRAQEGTSASTKNTASKTYRMIAGLTAKTLNTDLSGAVDVINGRLTLESGVAISITDQTAKTTIYFTPFKGNKISLYDGSAWAIQSFTERSLALGTLTTDTNYDVFIYSNAGTLTLELSAAWASATARTDSLVLQDGIYVKSGATTRRYLGTFRTTSATTTEDSIAKRLLWNSQNRVNRALYKSLTTTHNYTGFARQWNADPTAQVAIVTGFAEDLIPVSISGFGNTLLAGVFQIVGIGLDTTTTAYRGTRNLVWDAASSGQSMQASTVTFVEPQIGYHFLAMLESSENGGNPQFSEVYLSASLSN